MTARMWSWSIAATLLACAIRPAGASCAPQGEARQEDAACVHGPVGHRIEQYVQAAGGAGFSGAVLAGKGGGVVAAVAVGSADLADKVANTPATLFEIASATKQFTAAAVMRLVQDGKLRLDDPIAKHLPGVPESCRAITVRHLLQHTSGIPGSNVAGGRKPYAEAVRSFLRSGPRHAPGTHWEYWNQGYALLSEIIARVSGMSYTTYCKQALFEKAGLRATCFTGDPAPAGASVAMGRSDHGAPRSALEHPYGSYGLQYRGMGGVVTTVWDLWRWDRALRGEKVLAAEAKEELFRPGPGEYALGWFVRRRPPGRLVQSHGGAVRGFVCEMRRYPEADAFLVVLANRDDAPVSQLALALEQILFDAAPKAPLPPRPLDDGLAWALDGRYEDARGRQLVIATKDGTTRARILWYRSGGPVTHAVIGLDAGGKPVFHEWADATRIALEREDGGRVAAVSIRDQCFRRAR